MDGEPIEGSYRSHQVPAREVKTKQYQLQFLEDWLRSYHIEELFDQGHPIAEILELCPQGDLRLGCNPHTFGGRIRQPLNLPNICDYEVAVERVATAGVCQWGKIVLVTPSKLLTTSKPLLKTTSKPAAFSVQMN